MGSSHDAFSAFKTKTFARFARKARITDSELWKAAEAVNQGCIDADLGGGVVKQRIARAGQGKSGGSRSIILLRRGHRAVFVFGFEKKDQANISEHDLLLFRELAFLYLDASKKQMTQWIEAGALQRIEFQANLSEED
ncbi:MAG TPA: type II toxin-antitoxin system RelE/ParE family toxin [Acidobacteriaceae bacterium]